MGFLSAILERRRREGQLRSLAQRARESLRAGDVAGAIGLCRRMQPGPEAEAALAEVERDLLLGETAEAADAAFEALSRISGVLQETLAELAEHLGEAAYKPGWRQIERRLPTVLFHFTDLSNLPLILSRGAILSRLRLELEGIQPERPGGDGRSWWQDRSKGVLDYVHLSFSAPHPMLFAAAARIPRPVYFAINPRLTLRKETLFSDRNATDTEAVTGGSVQDCEGV